MKMKMNKKTAERCIKLLNRLDESTFLRYGELRYINEVLKEEIEIRTRKSIAMKNYHKTKLGDKE